MKRFWLAIAVVALFVCALPIKIASADTTTYSYAPASGGKGPCISGRTSSIMFGYQWCFDQGASTTTKAVFKVPSDSTVPGDGSTIAVLYKSPGSGTLTSVSGSRQPITITQTSNFNITPPKSNGGVPGKASTKVAIHVKLSIIFDSDGPPSGTLPAATITLSCTDTTDTACIKALGAGTATVSPTNTDKSTLDGAPYITAHFDTATFKDQLVGSNYEACANETYLNSDDGQRNETYDSSSGVCQTFVAGGGAGGETIVLDAGGSKSVAANDALDCGAGALSWIVCSVIQGAQSAANTLDSFITSQLNVDASGIFEKTTVQNSNSNGYYTAWNSFRIISMALLIIAGLVMVASQALGFEALDAYTVRKTLPRLLVAIIGISLSWPLMDFVVQFFDTLGHDVGNLIYYPFNHLASNISVQAGLSTILIAGGAVLVLGFASLTFILTGLLAMFVAFITLVIRQVALIILVILAPIGIACYVLPGTQKVWKLWRENFLGLLLMFPIVMAFIAAGHVFSAVSLNAGAGNSPASTVTQLVGILGYFIPYFMLPLAFRMATGAVGNIAGFVNDRHKGAFDRLKGVRSNAMQKNMADMKTGTRFNNRGLNALTSHATTSRFGLGARGRAAYNQKMDLAAMEFAKSNPGQALQHNDPALRAMTYGSEIEAKRNMARDFGMTEAEVDRGIVAAKAAGGFGRARQVWATQQLSNTATGYDNLEQVGATIARVSHGNESQIESLAGNINSGTKAVGRPDLAPGFSDLAALAKAESRQENTTARYAAAHIKAAGAMDGLSTMRGKPAEVKAVANNLTAHLRNNPGDEVNERKLHEMINGFSYGNNDSQNHLIRAIRGGTDENGNAVLGLDPTVGNNQQIIDHLERTLEAVRQGRNGYDPNTPGGPGSGAPEK